MQRSVGEALSNKVSCSGLPEISESLQPRGHVDAVAVDVRALDDDIPQVDADAQPDPPVPGEFLLFLQIPPISQACKPRQQQYDLGPCVTFCRSSYIC